MGILLSKAEDSLQQRQTETAEYEHSRKRKRRSNEGGSKTQSRRKRVKLSSERATPNREISIDDSSIEESQEPYPQPQSNGSNRVFNSSSYRAEALDGTYSFISKRSGNSSGGPGLKAAVKGSGTSKEASAANSLSIVTPIKQVKSKRKRNAPASPYFEGLAPNDSLPPTPPPSDSRNTLKQKSKISILESFDVLPSLPHFRPTSPDEFGLIQEKLRHDPWKMLVAVIFLNVTTAKMALPLLAELFKQWPTPEALSKANFEELSAFLHPIGLYNTRARRLIEFSTMWLSDPPKPDIATKRKGLGKYPPTAISHLPGMGVYALDSWRMFCAGEDEWRNVQPTDKELQAWMRWRWAKEGNTPVLSSMSE